MPGLQVTVLVAESQPLFRDALARVVRRDPLCRLVGEEVEGRSALHAIRTLRPDVALLGSPLEGLAAERVARAVVRDRLLTRAVLLLSEGDAAFRALGGGAAACLTRSVGEEA